MDSTSDRAFLGGGQDFLDLKLSEIEKINHNTKRFRFQLPENHQVSGLKVACTSFPPPDKLYPLLTRNSSDHHEIHALWS